MNEELLNNIWSHFSDENLTDSDYDTWKNNVSQSEEVQNNIHSYLTENGLTESDFNTWKGNLGIGGGEAMGAGAIGTTAKKKRDTSMSEPSGETGGPVSSGTLSRGDEMGLGFETPKKEKDADITFKTRNEEGAVVNDTRASGYTAPKGIGPNDPRSPSHDYESWNKANAQREADEAYTKAQMEKEKVSYDAKKAKLDALAKKERDELVTDPLFQEDLSKITVEAMNMTEEDAVKEFSETYGKYGFLFRETGIGDAIEVLGPNREKVDIDLQAFFGSSRESEKQKLQNFIAANADTPKNPMSKDTDVITKSQKAQSIRSVGRDNGDGSTSTVLMESGEVDGKYVVYPTLFPNKENYTSKKEDWEEVHGINAYKEALKRGEAFEFKTEAEAQKFAEGQWKNVSKVDLEANSFWAERGADYSSYKEKYDEYEGIKDEISFIDTAPARLDKLTKPEQEKYGHLYKNGQLRIDVGSVKNRLEDKKDDMMEFIQDPKYMELREDFDVHIDKVFKKSADEAVAAVQTTKQYGAEISKYANEYFGVEAKDLKNVKPKNADEAKVLDALLIGLEDAKASAKMAADKFELANSYMGAKFDEDLRGELVDNFEGFSDAWKKGINRGRAGEQILGAMLGFSDLDNDSDVAETANKIVNYLKATETGKQGRASLRYAQADGLKEIWQMSKNDPIELMGAFVSESLSQMLPYGWKIIGTTAAVGAGTGAAYGSMGANPLTVAGGALAGLGKGTQTGFAATSMALEYTNAVLDAVTNHPKYDIADPNSLAKALRDDDIWSEGAEIGLKRGIPIALMDMISGKLAGRIFKVGTASSTTAKVIAGGGERLVFDPVFEGVGEFAAMATAGQKIDAKEILAESIGGLGNNSANMAVNKAIDNRWGKMSRTVRRLQSASGIINEKSSSPQLLEWVNKMNKLGRITTAEADKIKSNIALKDKASDVLTAGGNKPKEKATARMMNLMKAQEELTKTPERKEVFAEKISQIKEEIKDLAATGKVRGTDTQVELKVKKPAVVEARTEADVEKEKNEKLAELDKQKKESEETGETAVDEEGNAIDFEEKKAEIIKSAETEKAEIEETSAQEVKDLEDTIAEAEGKKSAKEDAAEPSLIDGKPVTVDETLPELEQEKAVLEAEKAKAEKALSKQKTKVVIADSHADFVAKTKAAGLYGGKGAYGRGVYDSKNNVIYINPEKSNRRTVAHEAVHAVLVKALGGSDARVGKVVDTVYTALKSADIPAETRATLEKFQADYKKRGKTAFLNEEFLAELGGIMAEENSQIPLTVKDKLVQFVKDMMRAVGMNVNEELTAAEAVGIINGIANAVREGKSAEAVSEKIKAVEERMTDKEKAAEARKEAIASKEAAAKAERIAAEKEAEAKKEATAAKEAAAKEAKEEARKAKKKAEADKAEAVRLKAAAEKRTARSTEKKNLRKKMVANKKNRAIAKEKAAAKEAKAIDKANKKAEAVAKAELRAEEFAKLVEEAKEKAVSVGEFINNVASSIQSGAKYASKAAVETVKKILKKLIQGAVITGIVFGGMTMSFNQDHINLNPINYITETGTLNVEYVAASHQKMFPFQSAIILDKQNRQIYVYDGSGNVIYKSEAIIGADKGDNRQFDKLKTIPYSQKAYKAAGVRITPSGVFNARKVTDPAHSYGAESTWQLKETRVERGDGSASVVAFHANLKVRESKVGDGNLGNNAASMGCFGINLSDFKGVEGQLSDNAQVYIVPETDNREVYSEFLNERFRGSDQSFSEFTEREQMDDINTQFEESEGEQGSLVTTSEREQITAENIKEAVEPSIGVWKDYNLEGYNRGITLPNPQSIESVLEKSGGYAMFINSDGTKVGVRNNGELLDGGWQYTYIDDNVKDNIGFAATDETHVKTLHSLSKSLAEQRDTKNPKMKGKPLTVFVTVQNGSTMLGEWYGGEFFMEGVDKALTDKNITIDSLREDLKDAIYKQPLINTTEKKIKEVKANPTAATTKKLIAEIENSGKLTDPKRAKIARLKLDPKSIEGKEAILKLRENVIKIKEAANKGESKAFLDLVFSPKFKTHKGRIAIAKKLGSKEFTFGFRVNLLKSLIPLKAASGNFVSLKSALKQAGYGRQEFYKEHLDESLLETLIKSNWDETSIGGVTLGGYFADPYQDLKYALDNRLNGIDHNQFNESFSSNGETFRLDNAYNVNKLSPDMGFPTEEGIELYNEENNTSITKKTASIADRHKIVSYLRGKYGVKKGKKALYAPPFTSIGGSMYTATNTAREQIDTEQVMTAHSEAGGSSITQEGQNIYGTSNYSISAHPDRSKVVDGKDISEQDLLDFAEKNADLLQDKKNFIGTWYDEQGGKTYIDITTYTPNKDEAIKIAKDSNQIAIFDLFNGEEIDTEGTGEAVTEREQMVLETQKETNFVPVSYWVESLKGRTEYLSSVVSNILRIRNVLSKGEVSKGMVVKSYLITMASQGSGGGWYSNWSSKTGQTVDDVFIETQNGKQWIRPEGAAAAYVVSKEGKKLVSDIANGTATESQILAFFNFVGTGYQDSKTKHVYNTLKSGGVESMTTLLNENKGSNFKELIDGAIKFFKGIGDGKSGFFNQFLGVSGQAVIDARELNAWIAGEMNLTNEQKDLKRKVISSPSIKAELISKIKEVGIALGFSEDLAGYMAHHAIWDGIKNSITTHQGEYDAVFYDNYQAREQLDLPAKVHDVLTTNEDGQYVFKHYSTEPRKTIKPMSGDGKNLTGREEAAAMSTVGGMAQYYVSGGRREGGTGDSEHTVAIEPNKVYYFNSDVENFYDIAEARFKKKFPNQAFSANHQVAWITKVANENGYDMVVSNWRGPKDYRAQTTLELTPDKENPAFKKQPKDTIEVGDTVLAFGKEQTVTKVSNGFVSFESEGSSGRAPINRVQKVGTEREQLDLQETTERESKGTDSTAEEIVRIGRENGFSDITIKTVLEKKKFSEDDINSAMELNIDLFDTLPDAFIDVKGGVKEGTKMFDTVIAKLRQYAKPRTYKGKKVVKTTAQLRARAEQELRNTPEFKNQNKITQSKLISALNQHIAPVATKRISKQAARIKALRADSKNLRQMKLEVKNFLRRALPKSDTYSKAQLERAIAIVNNAKVANFKESVDKVLSIVEQQRTKMKKATLARIKAMVIKFAKKNMTGSNRVRARNLDAGGQSFFSDIKDIIAAAVSQDVDTLIGMSVELSVDNNDVADAIAKEEAGEKLGRAESRLLNRVYAFDSLVEMADMSLEELLNIEQTMKMAGELSANTMKARKAMRAMERKAIQEEAEAQISETMPSLYKTVTTTDPKTGVKTTKKVLLTENERARRKAEVQKNLNDKKLGSAFSNWMKNTFAPDNKLSSLFNSGLAHLNTLTNILDRVTKGKNFFTDNVYNNLNRMDENFRRNKQEKRKVLDKIASSIKGIKNYSQITDKLLKGGSNFTLTNGETVGTNKDALLRLYALSLNKTQRDKLEKQGWDIDEIKNALDPELVEFADKMVEYLTTQSFDEVNAVYSDVNNINLPFIDNYFPTETVSKSDTQKMISGGDFNGVFSAENSPALSTRKDVKSEVKEQNKSFVDALEGHIDSMEKYKAFALGVQRINDLFSSEAVAAALDVTGMGPVLRQAINFAISPNSVSTLAGSKKAAFLGKFVSFVLGFKVWQFPKQAVSFMNAYEKYKYFNNRVARPLDLTMFLLEGAKLALQIPIDIFGGNGPIHQAMEISASFRDRVRDALSGDVYGIESGSQVVKPISKSSTKFAKTWRYFQMLSGSPTTFGDIAGVMGYLITYNRDIKNGMSKEEALLNFNDYNATQQSRRNTDKVPLQMNPNMLVRSFTMFTSSMFLQINKIHMSTLNIMRSFSDRQAPRAQDIRALTLNLAVVNGLFAAVAGIWKLIKGDDEDKEELWATVKKAMIGLNQLYSIPLLGTAAESAQRKLNGERTYSSDVVNPLDRFVTKAIDAYGDEDWRALTREIAGVSIGINTDPFVGMYNLFKDIEDTDAMYDVLGVSKSYRPKNEKKKEAPKSFYRR